MISPMIFRQKGLYLVIKGDNLLQLLDHPRSILWCKEGIYGLIRIERVKNAISLFKDCSLLVKKMGSISFVWNDVIEISSETGRELERGGSGNGKSIK